MAHAGIRSSDISRRTRPRGGGGSGRPVAPCDRLRAGARAARRGRCFAASRAGPISIAGAGIVPRAPRPRHLHRRVRARLAARGCQGLSHRRRARGQGSRRADRALPRRQFRLRLQLARRRRAEGAASHRPGPCLELDSRRISSAPTSSSNGARSSAPSRCSASTSAPARSRWPSPTSSTATSIAGRSGASCGGRTATIGRTTSATGASATRWTDRGRSGRCRRASMAARPATPPSRCESSIPACSSSPAGRAARSCRPISRGIAKSSRNATTQVDGISLHAYYGNTKEWSGNSTARFLAMNLDMDRHIHEIAAVCDYVQALQKSPQAAVAVVRRVERLVSRAQRDRPPTAIARRRPICSRRSTTSRTRCSSAASSTRCCGIPTASGWRAWRSSST